MKDYGPQYQKAAGKRQKVARRNGGRERQGGHTWLWRATGVLAMFVTAVGVVFSLWFGSRINSGLDELSVRQTRLQELQERHGDLQQQREGLLAEERIQAAARQMGLYPPAADQVNRL